MFSSPNNLNGQRVVLGLSGGVDSAVAAALLQERGADVHALHMTNWDDDDGYCTAARDLQDAREVCDQLGMPLHHVNFSAEYRDRVFAYFLAEYRAGRTPNPDVLCNREIKFGVFREYARRLGGDWLATGHYARIHHEPGGPRLLKGADSGKDQSYFLHAVTAEALAETLFPLGELQKSEVRNLAREYGLPTSEKKDSTGICFIGERPFREFLATYLPANPGPVCTPDRRQIGDHHGLMYYTIGQRQGLGLGGRKDTPEGAWYVAGKDMESNSLIVVQGDHALLYSQAIDVSDEAWIAGQPLAASGAVLDCAVKVRYRQADQDCRLSRLPDGGLRVSFREHQRAVACGQFAVFYAGDECLGGGIIDRVHGIEQPLQNAG